MICKVCLMMNLGDQLGGEERIAKADLIHVEKGVG